MDAFTFQAGGGSQAIYTNACIIRAYHEANGNADLKTEIITTACTILLGAILIFCWDLLIKPLNYYRKHLENVLFGRVHEATLPFVFLSEEINVVDGVACRMLTCQDTDAKGRLYDRLFYLDAEKSCPEFKEGEMVLVLHHDLIVADVTAA